MPPKRARKPKKKSTNKLSQSQTVIINRGGGGRGGKSKTTTSTTKASTQQPINISHVTHVYNDRKTETKTEPAPSPSPKSPAPEPSPFSGMFSTPMTSSPFPTTPPAPSPFFGMSSPVLTPTPSPTTSPSPFSGLSSLPSDFSIRQESPPFASYGYGGMRRRQFPTGGGGGGGATEPIIEEPEEYTEPPPPSSRFTRIEDITQPIIRIPQQLPPFSNIPQFPSIPRNIFESMQQAETQQSVTQPLILPSEPMASMLQIEDEPPPPPMASMLQIEDAPPPPPKKDIRDDAERVQQALLNEYSPPLKPSPPPPPPPVRQRGRPVEPISEEDINILDRYVRGLSIPPRNRTPEQVDAVLRGSRLKHNKRNHPDLVGIINGLREIYFPGK